MIMGRNGSKREKKKPRWNGGVKVAIRAKKTTSTDWLNARSALRTWYTEVRKAAAQAVKLSKEETWKEFGQRLEFGYRTAKKYSDKPPADCGA